MNKWIICWVILAVMLLSSEVSADVVVKALNTSDDHDSYAGYYSTGPNGDGGYMIIGQYVNYLSRYYRMFFDYKLPAGTGTITEVNISLYCYNTGRYHSNSHALELHELLQGFDEATMTWDLNETGSNWCDSPDVPGCYNSTVVSTKNIAGGFGCNANPGYMTWTLMGPQATNGLTLTWEDTVRFEILQGVDKDRWDYFRTKEYATIAQHPYMTITYASSGGTVLVSSTEVFTEGAFHNLTQLRDLNCSVNAVSSEYAGYSANFTWWKNGVNQPTFNSGDMTCLDSVACYTDTYVTSPYTSVLDEWNCSVRVWDGDDTQNVSSDVKTVVSSSAPSSAGETTTAVGLGITAIATVLILRRRRR